METIFRLNNDAATMMLQNNDHSAQKALQDAFVRLKAEVVLKANIASNPELRQQQQQQQLSRPAEVSYPIHYSNEKMDCMEDNEWTLHSRPLVFQQDRDARCYNGPLDVHISVILFNLALLYHRAALRSPHDRAITSCAISKATSLYSMSRRLARMHCCEGSNIRVQAAASVFVIASNNLSRLQFGQGEAAAAQATFAEVVCVLQQVRAGFFPESLGRDLGDIYLNVFSWNTVIAASAA